MPELAEGGETAWCKTMGASWLAPPPRPCLGSGCAAWVYLKTSNESGYCGLADSGAPLQRLVTFPDPARAATKEGS